MLPPITITLYGKDNEIVKTFERPIVPWGMLKKAAAIQQMISADEKKTAVKQWYEFWKKTPTETIEVAQMNAISQFIVDLFGKQFTVRELEDGADIGEIMTVFRTVLSRAGTSVKSNPTPKPSSPK